MITTKIQYALSALKQGQLIGLPTETVYGLGADAKNHAAVQAIFKLKNARFQTHLSPILARQPLGKTGPLISLKPLIS